MANFDGNLPTEHTQFLFSNPGTSSGAYDQAPQTSGRNVQVGTVLAIGTVATVGDSVIDSGSKKVHPFVNHDGDFSDYATTPAIDFFEHFHILPRSLAFGNILGTQSQSIEVFSGFRKSQETWDTFTNNAGAGVSLIGAPSLPSTVQPLLSVAGLSVEVTLNGSPSVNTTLDFGFSSETIALPITLERVVLWSVPPQLPYGEFLEFLTEIMRHKDGSEQRVRLRKNPRQTFEWDFLLLEGKERSILDNLLFGWQHRSFGIPIWHELTPLTVAATAGDTVITVQSTAYADYRTTGSNLVLIYQDQDTFDVQPLTSLTATTLTLSSPLNNSYAAGVHVMPLRVGVAKKTTRGGRFIKGLSRVRMEFRVEDNDISIGDTSAFSSYDSKVLMDDYNLMTGGELKELFTQNMIVLDNGTGLTYQDSPWAHNKHAYTKTFYTNTRQSLWEHRQLMHSLGGKNTSFYLPTFADDMEVLEDLASGTPSMAITNVGYTKFVASQVPHNVIRISFNNGDPPLVREILSSVEDSTTKETLTLDDNWPSNYLTTEVSRVEYVELMRFNTDRIAFRHQVGDRVTKIQGSVVVTEE